MIQQDMLIRNIIEFYKEFKLIFLKLKKFNIIDSQSKIVRKIFEIYLNY